MARFASNDIISLVGEAPRFDLAESVGPDLRLSELLAGAGPALDELALGYGTAAGGAALREAIAGVHGVAPDDVTITAGGMHALFLLAFLLCERGDEAVVAAPLFPLANNVLQAVGATTRALPLAFDAGYQPDLAALRELLSRRTRLVSLASPQNPSGVAIQLATLRQIVALLAQHAPEAWLLVDETYREAAYGSDPVAASAIELGPRVISVASLSKCHGAPGLRIGWAITRDPALREQLVTAKFNTIVSCSPVDEALALVVLQQRERILGERRVHLARNLALTADWVQRASEFVEWVRPDAGALCCVRLRASAFADSALPRFHAALAQHGVRVGPGSWFGEDKRVFRLGFGLLKAPQLAQALEGVSAALRETARPA
jgi:aspartate/methionine/tyrosine aminotransferase